MISADRFPMPNENFDGSIVIASTVVNDEPCEEYDALALVILLRKEAPFYSVGELVVLPRRAYWSQVDGHRLHYNINYAVEDFADSGGDV